MDLKKLWNSLCAPTAFFLGALYMLIGETGVGCVFIMFGTNEIVNKQ